MKKPLLTADAASGMPQKVHAAGSDTVKIGLVGCGGRGRGALQMALRNASHKNVKVTALADAFEPIVKATKRMFMESFAEQTEVADDHLFSGLDAGKKLMETEVDVVLLCEPPGFRPGNFLLAAEAGKHIFAEKPVATDPEGVRLVRKGTQIAKEKGKIVLVGHHLRFEPKHIEPIQMLHDGLLGDLLYIRIFFNDAGVWVRRRNEGETEMQYQIRNWYYFNWLSGDHLVEQHVHDIDVMNWMAGDRVPLRANGMGGRQVRINPDCGEIFDHHSIEYQFDDVVRGYSNCRHIPHCWNSFSEHAVGTKGTLDIQGHGEAVLKAEGKEPVIWKRTYDGHQIEMDVLFEHLVRGRELNRGESACDATLTAILGRMATYSGKVISWEDAKNSTLDLFPKVMDWKADPGPKPGPDGIYPCAEPGKTDLRSWGIGKS
jgi:predicted dehydrogenase